MDPPKRRRFLVEAASATASHDNENGRPEIPCPGPSPSGADSAAVGSAAPPPSNEKRKASKKRAASAATASAAGADRRTRSFDPVWSGTLADPGRASEVVVEPHTLILGTHPSRESLARGKYYAFPTK
jgi:tRNA G26 N,N-dimethylase Trm1